jgi:hypothetical protein
MVSVAEFHTVVFDYLSLSIDRKVFTLRFAALLSGIEKYGDPPAVELCNALYSHLVLAIAGAITEDELRNRLAKQLEVVSVAPQYLDENLAVVKTTVSSASSYKYDPADLALV